MISDKLEVIIWMDWFRYLKYIIMIYDINRNPLPLLFQDSQFQENTSPKVDCGVQTVLHPIETYIDKNYYWNEWELRKNALKLVSNPGFKYFIDGLSIMPYKNCDICTK